MSGTAIYSNEAQSSDEQIFLENVFFQLITCLQLMLVTKAKCHIPQNTTRNVPVRHRTRETWGRIADRETKCYTAAAVTAGGCTQLTSQGSSGTHLHLVSNQTEPQVFYHNYSWPFSGEKNKTISESLKVPTS